VVQVANTDRRTTQSRVYIVDAEVGVTRRRGGASGAKEGRQ
ncbi:hypothetical protein L195_g062177, partial [Trifolium pratense]